MSFELECTCMKLFGLSTKIERDLPSAYCGLEAIHVKVALKQQCIKGDAMCEAFLKCNLFSSWD